MRVLLVATYELGHQPLSLATLGAELRRRGHDVRCIDVSVEPWDLAIAEWADEIAFSVPMHTAARMARELARGLERPVRCFGLYADQCADFATTAEWRDVIPETGDPPLPARDLLPPLDRYTRLSIGDELRIVGSVAASHGCAHRCRHCPVPVVYDGRVARVAELPVLADIAQLVSMGAQHITFGDPDFLNAPPHSLRIVRALHDRYPELTFDCTVKVEHVLRHAEIWDEMSEAGCIFVVSAFESTNDAILERLDKGHTAAGAARAVDLLRRYGIDVRPSFLPFTPWSSTNDVIELLDFVYRHDLVGSVDPVQYAIRLLLPEGSLLLDHADLRPHLGEWDDARMSYSWTSADPAMDAIQLVLAKVIEDSTAAQDSPIDAYRKVRAAIGAPALDLSACTRGRPRLTESWFCCAEPTDRQLARVQGASQSTESRLIVQ